MKPTRWKSRDLDRTSTILYSRPIKTVVGVYNMTGWHYNKYRNEHKKKPPIKYHEKSFRKSISNVPVDVFSKNENDWEIYRYLLNILSLYILSFHVEVGDPAIYSVFINNFPVSLALVRIRPGERRTLIDMIKIIRLLVEKPQNYTSQELLKTLMQNRIKRYSWATQ